MRDSYPSPDTSAVLFALLLSVITVGAMVGGGRGEQILCLIVTALAWAYVAVRRLTARDRL